MAAPTPPDTAERDKATHQSPMGQVESALAEVHRREWALVVAATVRAARDLDLAEECVQETCAAAVTVWARDGVPANPAAWLTTTARRCAFDVLRREQTLRAKLPLLIEPDDPEPVERDPRLNSYPYLPVVKADLLARLNRREDAVEEYRRARRHTRNRVEQQFLDHRIAGI